MTDTVARIIEVLVEHVGPSASDMPVDERIATLDIADQIEPDVFCSALTTEFKVPVRAFVLTGASVSGIAAYVDMLRASRDASPH